MMSAPVNTLSAQTQVWSTIAAIEHAVHRVRAAGVELTDIDIDRLRELQELLSEARKPRTVDETIRRLTAKPTVGSLAAGQLDRLAEGVRNSATVQAWLPKQRLGWEKKVERLEGALADFVAATTRGEVLSKPDPPEEFAVLDDVMHELVQLKMPRAGSHLV